MYVYVVSVLLAGRLEYVGVYGTRMAAEMAQRELRRDYRGAVVSLDGRPVVS